MVQPGSLAGSMRPQQTRSQKQHFHFDLFVETLGRLLLEKDFQKT